MHGETFNLPTHGVVRAPGFDKAAARLGISPRLWDELLEPLEYQIACDPLAFGLAEGRPRRVAPLLLPNGRYAAVHYEVGAVDRPGVALCVLTDVLLPDGTSAP